MVYEERDFRVAQLEVGTQAVAVSRATARLDGFTARRFHVLKHEIVVVIVALEVEFDFYYVAADEAGSVR